MTKSPITVLLVDDSPLVLKILERMLSKTTEVQVVGTAHDGIEALDLIPTLEPDVICTDIHMPKMDGLEFVNKVMKKFPRPILIISISAQRNGSRLVFEVLKAGAIDVFPKPDSGSESDYLEVANKLIEKIKIISGVHVFRKKKKKASIAAYSKVDLSQIEKEFHARIIVIGASTGGPQALQAILSKLPADFPVPIICIQHISEEFQEGLMEWLNSLGSMKVTTAMLGEIPLPGNLYLPDKKAHLIIDNRGRFYSSVLQEENGFTPSINVTMKSLAEYYGNSVMGILLSGMGDDGAEGMVSIFNAGGITIAQDEESCVVYGMPKVAVGLGAVKYIYSPDEIAEILVKEIYHQNKKA